MAGFLKYASFIMVAHFSRACIQLRSVHILIFKTYTHTSTRMHTCFASTYSVGIENNILSGIYDWKPTKIKMDGRVFFAIYFLT